MMLCSIAVLQLCVLSSCSQKGLVTIHGFVKRNLSAFELAKAQAERENLASSNTDCSQLDRIIFNTVRFCKWVVFYQLLYAFLTRWFEKRPSRKCSLYRKFLAKLTKLPTKEKHEPSKNRLERLSLVLKAFGLIGEEHNQGLARVVAILEDLHKKHGVVDLFGEHSLQDIMKSAVVLSALQQRCNTISTDCALTRNDGYPMQRSGNVDKATLDELTYYAVYASAAYGWKLDLAMRGKFHSADDMKTLTRRTGVQQRDILVAKWASTPRRPAYFLARDHRKKAVVLSIRGTFSMDDILTDLCCTTSEIDVSDASTKEWSNGYVLVNRILSLLGHSSSSNVQMKCRAHSGMLQAAESLRSELSDILDAELQSAPAYSLVIVGHSMAGGIAALLGVLLNKSFSNLKVFAYGPVPCVSFPANGNNLGRMSKYIASVIHENDPFKAMSLQHVADLSCKLSRLCSDHQLRDSIVTRLLTSRRSRLHDAWLVSIHNDLNQHSSVDKLYPPGKVILLSRMKKKRGFMHLLSRRRLTAREAGQFYFDDLEFPSLAGFSLHSPTSYEQCLRKVSLVPEVCPS